MRRPRYTLPALLLALSLAAIRAQAGEVAVAVAANFSAPFHAISGIFSARTGHTVKISTGSSGKLFAQIQHGAPFELFLSADTSKPEALVSSGHAAADSRFTYAVGRLALFSARRGTSARALLESGRFTHLAIANPRLAPYGRAAEESLQALGKWEAVQGQLVVGENIAQAWQFVATGNAELGLIALSQVIDKGSLPEGAWLVPRELHTPIRQELVLLARGQDNLAARELLDFLRSPEAAVIIRDFGYDSDPELN